MNSITTYTGKHFDPTTPEEEKLDIRDIAHALSMTCRGNGHVKSFFSVGQHCINCCLEAEARKLSGKIVLACLLHDAGEAYLSDVPRPFKRTLVSYMEQEERLLDLIYRKFLGDSLSREEIRQVKEIDDALLYYDLKELLGEQQEGNPPVLHIALNYEFVPFDLVEKRYLELFFRHSSYNKIQPAEYDHEAPAFPK